VDFPASDIVIPITSLSTNSNSLNGDARIVFENAADMVRYHTWFVNPFVNPAENNTRLERYWPQAATPRLEQYGHEKAVNELCKSFKSRNMSYLRLSTAN